jgi:signal transduction histidine kinase
VINVGVILLTTITMPSSPDTSTQQAGSHADNVTLVKQVADHFASSIEEQARGQTLSHDFPYPLGQPLDSNPDDYRDANSASLLQDSNLVPYLPRLYPNQPVTFALLIAPDRRILSSSYPACYPIGGQSALLLPEQESWITRALNGKETAGIFARPDGEMVYAAASVFDQAHRPVGAVYVQTPLATLMAPAPSADFLTTATLSLGISSLVALLLLIFLTPLGGIFGFISTRSLVKRLKKLASATTLVADGDYQQRLPVGSKDEIGQLEQQFNRMAEQLGESTARQQNLAEENARLAERSRISRELHDAISQDLFSISMLVGGLQGALPADSPLQRQVAVLEETTTNTIREMRALLLELRPTRLEQFGLVEALEELAAAYSTRLGMRVKTELARLSLEARKEHTLLRISQEALSNAARHASATEISMSLARQGNMVLFCLRDNGRGFQADSESSRHGLGLRLMQERVQELHGTFQLTSQPGQGTALEVLLPLEEDL